MKLVIILNIENLSQTAKSMLFQENLAIIVKTYTF
jgi:hypothetical protein